MRTPAQSFEDLLAWQKAHALTLEVYKLTRGFPREEVFGLTSQIRRASVGVAANIAEGFKRRGAQDKARFLNIAQASLEECRYYLILTRDLQYGDVTPLLPSCEEIGKLLTAYSKAILSRSS